jgi:hypothetical protein
MYRIPTYLPIYFSTYLQDQSFTRLVTKVKPHVNLYSWSHPQVSHKRLTMDGGAGGRLLIQFDTIMVVCLVFLPTTFCSQRPLSSLKALHGFTFMFSSLNLKAPPPTHTRCFLWVKWTLLFCMQTFHHSISKHLVLFMLGNCTLPLASAPIPNTIY